MTSGEATGVTPATGDAGEATGLRPATGEATGLRPATGEATGLRPATGENGRGGGGAGPDSLAFGLMAGGDEKRLRRLEALPIDSLWSGGHLASTNPSPEAMMQLARLAALTERVRIGTSILLLPLYPPALVAKQIADLDRSSGGRVILGVGVGGEYQQEFRAVGVPIEERGKRTDEAIPLIRRLWGGEEISHDGPFYPLHQVRIHPAPHQRGGPPIVVAGRKDPAMRRAALLGDGWMPYLYSPRRYGASVERVREVAAAHDRDLSGFGWYAFVFVNVDADGDAAREGAARTLGGTYRQDFRQMVDSVTAAGTASEVTAKLQAFVDAGARHFIFTPAPGTGDAEPVVQRLFDDVVPGLRVPTTEQSPTKGDPE